ncbi:MAG TPA: hypothetical protein VJR69_00665 [Nitrospira sp.]|nr:hypothetical protein [Nitrospira sp.]
MNAITLFLTLVRNGNLTCGSEVPARVFLGNEEVQVQVDNCYWSEEDLPPTSSW